MSIPICVALLDAVQIVFLALSPAPVNLGGLGTSIPTSSLGSFTHVFLGNEFIGTQELIPFYSVFAFARSLYLLVPSLTLLGVTWHATRAEVILRLFSFAYSWIEVSAYSYSVIKSFDFVVQILKRRTLTAKAVIRVWTLVTIALGAAACLEVMAMNVL